MQAQPDPRPSISLRLAVLLGLALTLAYPATWAGFQADPARRVLFGDMLLAAGGLLAAVSLFYGAEAAGKPGDIERERWAKRQAWALLAVAQLFAALGHAAHALLGFRLESPPSPSVADGLSLVYYPLFALGVLLLPGPGARRGERLKLLLDLGIILIAAGLILWAFRFGPQVALGAVDPLALASSLAEVVGDLGMFMALVVLLIRQLETREQPLRLLAIGVVVLVAARLVFGSTSLRGVEVSASLLDVAQLTSYVLLAWAGVVQANAFSGATRERSAGGSTAGQSVSVARAPAPVRRGPQAPEPRMLMLYLPYAVIGAAYLFLLWGRNRLLTISFPVLGLWVGGIIALALARQILSLNEDRRLWQAEQRQHEADARLNARLYAETQRRLLDQTLLYECSRDLALIQDVRQAIAAVAERMVRHLGATALCYYTYDETREAITADYEYWSPRATPGERRSVLGEAWPVADYPRTALALRTGTPQILHRSDPDLAPAEREMLAQWDGQTVLLVPMSVHDHILGYFEIWDSRAERDYDEADRQLLYALATEAAIAVDKARLSEEARRRDAVLEALAYASEKLLMPGDLNQVLPDVLAQLGRAAGVSRAYIFQNHSTPDGTLRASQRHLWSASSQMPLMHSPSWQQVAYLADGYGRWCETLSAGHPLYGPVRDFPPEERAALAPRQIRSLAVAPIFSGGDWWGYLGFDDCEQDRNWSAAEIEALKSAAGALGAAVTRQRSQASEYEQRALAEALRDTAAALNSTLNLDAVFERILASLGQVVPHDAANIMLLQGDVARVVRGRGYVERGAEDWTPHVKFHLSEVPDMLRVAETGQPIVIADAQAGAGLTGYPEMHWVRSYACAPICIQQRVLGIIKLDSATPGFFTLEHAERLQAFADQAAIAIENARLFEAELRQSELAEAMRDTAAALTSTFDFDDVLDRILANLGRVMPHDAANIMLVDAPASLVYVARSLGYAERNLETWLMHLRLPIAEFPNFRHMVETGQPLIIPDTDRYAGWVPVPEMSWLRAYAGAPIRVKGLVVGFLNLDSATPDLFVPEHAERLQLFADQAAVAIENAQLYNAVRQHADELEGRVAERTRELAAANVRLTELDRLKDQFISNVSHELRTPLTNIKLHLSLLDKRGPEALARYLPTLQRETERLRRLIEDLLDLSRLQAQTTPPRREPQRLDDLLAEVIALHTARAEARGLTLQYVPNPNGLMVPLDRAQMMQVFTNLVGNAVAYAPPGGHARITADFPAHGAGEVAIHFHNDGPPIPPDELPHLFERFFRGRTARDSGEPGTGLGLAICQEIVQRHGGRMDVTSREGEGTTFTVWLPLAV